LANFNIFITMNIPKGKKIYFALTIILDTNVKNYTSWEKFVAWLDEIKEDAAAIFLLEFISIFWFWIILQLFKGIPEHLEVLPNKRF
jgi:hypothetical protein